jgi:tetratricopeptide (TPR) repeat protein
MTKVEANPGTAVVSPRTLDPERAERDFRSAFHDGQNDANAQFVLGLTAYRDGRLSEALSHIGRALSLDPTNADFHTYHAATCAGLGRVEEAFASYHRALAIQPGLVEAHHGLGRLLVAAGQHSQAETSFREVLRQHPNHARASAELGDLLARQGRFDEAEERLRHSARLDPEDAETPRNLGNICMRRGKLEEAEAALRRSIFLRPGDADSYNDLGIVLARRNRREESIAAYREAIRLRPEFADAHNNLGNAFRMVNKLDESIACFQTALRLRPNYPEAHNNMAIALRQKGKYDEATASYHQALSLRPNYAEAHNNLGFAHACRGKAEPAVECFRQAIRLRPDYFEAQFNLANSLADLGRLSEAEAAYRRAIAINPNDARPHKNLGITLTRQEKYEPAIAAHRAALKLRPDFPDVHNDLGIALARQNKFAEAIASYREALRLRPDYVEVYNNLGNALRNDGQFAESIECYQKAIKLRPNYPDAHNNLGIAYAEAGKFDEAVASYSECIRINPTHVDARMNRALTWLRKGDYAQGWAEYEWRWKKRNLTNRPLIQPLWNGFPLQGRRILLITEQGFGDTLQFVRYCPILKAQGATVILECPERLIPLLSKCPGIDHLVPQGKPVPDYDVYAPLMSVPGMVGTGTENAPAEVPYLHPDSALVEKWRQELQGIEGFKVGINWQGNPQYAGDRHRSIPLKYFEPLSRIPGVRLISIQKNNGHDQLKELGQKFGIFDLGRRLDESTGPFLDTAAVMQNLDLFITSDTAVAHLAGAMGVPVWMALSTAADWRWMTVREDNPWYPSMRLFRQAEFMSWDPVFARIANELRRIAPVQSRVRSVTIEAAPGELLDKITILQIKATRIVDQTKLRNIQVELATLMAARDRTINPSEELDCLTSELLTVNESLWRIEDDIRTCERDGDFGERFIDLARSVYRVNDDRAVIKRKINLLLGSEIVEEKSYADVQPASFHEESPDLKDQRFVISI